MVPDLWLVGLGGVVGALLRYLTTTRLASDGFPTGTLTVNVVGSFVLGFVTVLGTGNAVVLFVGTGACGSYTTFSSFSFDTVRLWEDGEQVRAVAFAVGNLLGSIAAIALAWALARLAPV
ncbi:chromosome condensation protein CrcB [Halorientalis sp. IM1011]|uniref:fluoride efflux transporter CrcB n=1 Tax=Halorientalis sp. IM1011 TaxID=1932360 RepID=UPI00097CD66F|nr:fluoride efflux transporter CrcB [Halorientalis sp. IM1011]AQL44544.1 chromosome condensation protein CrcB [Halorientalis sp. IM1011]